MVVVLLPVVQRGWQWQPVVAAQALAAVAGVAGVAGCWSTGKSAVEQCQQRRGTVGIALRGPRKGASRDLGPWGQVAHGGACMT